MQMSQCTMCTLFSIFSRATEKLRPILEFEFWYHNEHIFVPACSSVRKIHFVTFLWFSNSRSVISPKICHCIHPFFRNYAPVFPPSSYCIGYSVIKDTVSSYFTKYTLCSVLISFNQCQAATVLGNCSCAICKGFLTNQTNIPHSSRLLGCWRCEINKPI